MKILVKSLEKCLAHSKPSAKLTLIISLLLFPCASHLYSFMCDISIHNISTVTSNPVFDEDPKALRGEVICPQSPSQLRDRARIRIEVTLVSKPMHVFKYVSAYWLILVEPSGRRCC